MITYENECVGCPPEIGCMGSACPYRYVPHYYCDNCGRELYEVDDNDRQICTECMEDLADEKEGE